LDGTAPLKLPIPIDSTLKARFLRVVGKWRSTSAHGGHLVTGSSLTRKLVVHVLNQKFAKFSNDFQTVWFVINIRDVVMTLHTYE